MWGGGRKGGTRSGRMQNDRKRYRFYISLTSTVLAGRGRGNPATKKMGLLVNIEKNVIVCRGAETTVRDCYLRCQSRDVGEKHDARDD